MEQILIIGAAGWHNTGDDILAEEIRDYVATHGREARLVGGPAVRMLDEARGLSMGASLRQRIAIIRAIGRSQGVFIGGGGLMDDRRTGFYRPFTRAAVIARLLRVPYAFIGIGVGPVRSKKTAKKYRRAIRGASKTMVRDQESAHRLTAIGCAAESIQIVGDPVTWKAVRPSTHPAYQWAINLREWEPSDADEGFQFDRDRVLANIVASVSKRLGDDDRVVLVSMSELTGDDDRAALERLRSAAGHPEWQIVSGIEAALRALQDSRNVLSMRLHGCLIGARSGARVLGLAYEPKVVQQAQRVGFTSISVEAAAEPAALESAFDSLDEQFDVVLVQPPAWPFENV